MQAILFSTTNINKVLRLQNFLDNPGVKICSLNDLDYKIPEPEESGSDPIQIAENKAKHYWDKLKIKMPVLAQDDTIRFEDIKELSQPRLSIKQPVIDKYGEFNDANAIKFYRELASKYGGSINMEFNYGFALIEGDKQYSHPAKLKCELVNEVSNKIQPGYFLNSIIKVKIGDVKIFYSELTLDQQKVVDSNLAGAVNSLINYIS